MKYFLLFLSIISLNTQLLPQSYTPFPDSNAMWTDEILDPLCNNTFLCSINQYLITGDTLINGNLYKKLKKSGYLINQNYLYTFYSEYAGAFRQDINNRKVFFFPPSPYPQIDTLLYDFNLAVGDSLPLTYNYPVNFCDAIIDSIDSVLVGSSFRKRFHISSVGAYPEETWLIEGIGCSHGLFSSVCVGWESWQHLTCFKQNDSIVYPSFNDDCNLITSIPEIICQSNFGLIFPNPVSSILTIYFSQKKGDVEIEIYDFSGRRQYLYSGGIQYFNTEIDVSKWPEGVYIIKIISDFQIVRFEKIVLNRKY